MNWSAVAHTFLPKLELLVALVYPEAAPVLPLLNDAIAAAQHLHGDTNNAAKKQLVFDAVSAQNLFDKQITIRPEIALQVTESVFSILDDIHTTITANRPTAVDAPSSLAPASEPASADPAAAL